jgi:transcriptional regulator with XRE-family HTH domain
MTKTTLGLALRTARQRAGLSQVEVARACGSAHRQLVANWEAGRGAPLARYLVRLARVLGLPLAQVALLAAAASPVRRRKAGRA